MPYSKSQNRLFRAACAGSIKKQGLSKKTACILAQEGIKIPKHSRKKKNHVT